MCFTPNYSSRTLGLRDLFSGAAGSTRKATDIRHNGKKLSDILADHAKFHKGYPGGVRADLSGADLSRINFQKCDLTGAILVGCKLRAPIFEARS